MASFIKGSGPVRKWERSHDRIMLGTTFWDAGPNKLGSSYKSNSGARTETANSHGGEKKNKPKKKHPDRRDRIKFPSDFCSDRKVAEVRVMHAHPQL